MIGRDPGENEEQTGHPFTGKAGQCLERLMQPLGINTKKDVYITNTLKCRPPNNTLPGGQRTLDLMDNCSQYLDKELDIIKPELIITLGREAFTAVYPSFPYKTSMPMKKWVGKIYPYRSPISRFKSKTLCAYHPAYIVRNEEKLTPVFLSHFQDNWDTINPLLLKE